MIGYDVLEVALKTRQTLNAGGCVWSLANRSVSALDFHESVGDWGLAWIHIHNFFFNYSQLDTSYFRNRNLIRNI